MAEEKKFIKGAIQHPGRLTAAAKKAGKSVPEYAQEHKHDPKGSIGDAARMYKNVLQPIAVKARKKR